MRSMLRPKEELLMKRARNEMGMGLYCPTCGQRAYEPSTSISTYVVCVGGEYVERKEAIINLENPYKNVAILDSKTLDQSREG